MQKNSTALRSWLSSCRMTLQANNTLLLQNDSLRSHCKSWHLQSSPITFAVGHGLQNKPYFWVLKYIYMQTVKQKVWSEASFFLSLTCPEWVWGLQDLRVKLWCYASASNREKKRLIWEKDQFFWSLYCKLVTFFSFRLRSLANVMGGRIPIPHQHPVEWTSLSPLLTWQTHATVAATPLVPTSHTYMTFQKMNLIDCCAW